MHGEFRSYNAAYANALNEQMLLNLARLENGHPAYYLVIGSITNRFIDTASATAGSAGTVTSTSNNTPFHGTGTIVTIATFPSRVLQTIFGYNGSAAYTHTKNPDFQFIPLNNEQVSEQILKPALPEIFFTLYQQGYPIDQLMRVMIERVETTLPGEGSITLFNLPARGELGTDPEPPGSYARFLRGCAILREMQRRGYLTLRANSHYEKIGNISFDTPNTGGRVNPTSKEFAEAEEKGFVLKNVDDQWEIGRKRSSPLFVLTAHDPDEVVRRLAGDKHLAPLDADTYPDTYKAVKNVVDLLTAGIAVQTSVESSQHATTRLVLRSFDRSMAAVATEQPTFEEFENSQSEIKMVPATERRPILQMMWPDKSIALEKPLQTVHYSGKMYAITDPVPTNALASTAHWNRDVFRLLVALNSQVTVDISKFQQQTFQLLPAPGQ
jgi:hypothetical protein